MAALPPMLLRVAVFSAALVVAALNFYAAARRHDAHSRPDEERELNVAVHLLTGVLVALAGAVVAAALPH